jgi:CRP/FNR family transcriptional regulator, cyclic AMP receptor protein
MMRLVKDELRDLDLFSGATRSELAVIARHLTLLAVPAGRVLVREGARGDEFMIMVEGEVEVSQRGQRIATLGRGELVGEMALLHEGGAGKRNATVTALTDIAVYVGSAFAFRQVLSAAPSVAEKIHQTVASRSLVVA